MQIYYQIEQYEHKMGGLGATRERKLVNKESKTENSVQFQTKFQRDHHRKKPEQPNLSLLYFLF